MKWVQNSLFLARSVSAGFATATMVFAPVAQGAAAANANGTTVKASAKWVQSAVPKINYNYNIDKSTIQELLKISGAGTNKKITVGEFYQRVRPYLPETLASEMGQWAILNRNQIMPEFQVTTYRASEGKDQLRIILTKDKQSVTMSFDPESDTKFLRVNNVDLSKKDMLFHEQAFRKMANNDKPTHEALQKPPVDLRFVSTTLGYEEFSRLNARQQATYLAHLRYLALAAERVGKIYNPKSASNAPEDVYEFFARVLVGDAAEAAMPKAGQNCIVNGYISIYGQSTDGLSCGGGVKGRANLQAKIAESANGNSTGCPSGSLPCNELMYSYKPSGDRYCVKDQRESILMATSQACPDQSPLRKGTEFEIADKKAIVENYMKHHEHQAIDLKFNKDGRISHEQYAKISKYLNDLNKYVDDAMKTCLSEPLRSITKTMDDQRAACNALEARKISILQYDVVTNPPPVVLPPALPPEEKVCTEPEGSIPKDGKCACDGVLEQHPVMGDDGKEHMTCVAAGVIVTAPPHEQKDCSTNPKVNSDGHGGCVAACGWWCNNASWAVPAGLAVGILAFWIGNKGHDDKKPAPVTPVPQKPLDPCPPAPYACTPTNPIAPVAPKPKPLPPLVVVVTPTPAPAAPAPPSTPAPILPPAPVAIPPVMPTTVAEVTNSTTTSTADGVGRR